MTLEIVRRFVDGAWKTEAAEAGGGGSQPAVEQINGVPVSIANGGLVNLSWDTSAGPDSLLDLTVPTVPTVKTAGFTW